MERIKKFMLSKETVEVMENLSAIEGPAPASAPAHLETQFVKTQVPQACSALGSLVMSDVEMIQGAGGNTVLDALFEPALQGTRAVVEAIISVPIYDIQVLKQRQAVLRQIAPLVPQLVPLLQTCRETETDMLSMYHEEREFLDLVYFKFKPLRHFNADHRALSAYNLYRMYASPAVGILSPLVYVVIPYLILRIKMGIKIGLVDYAKVTLNTILTGTGMSKLSYISFAFSVLFYFQGIFNQLEISRAIRSISDHIRTKMDNVARFVCAAEAATRLLSAIDVSPFGLENAATVLQEFYDTPPPFYMCGKQLEAYKNFKKDHYVALIRHAYAIDALSCFKPASTSFPTYLKNASPTKILVRGLIHPCLINPVKNDLDLDRNMLLTGPNAGGKSTLIKALLIAILLAQTYGIAPADAMEITPFHHIGSQMNVPDCKGKESLFEAEMYRSRDNIQVLKDLAAKKPRKRSIFFMDEIFSSTNPVEGMAGAYAIANKMAGYPNNLCVITTHYLYLAKLAQVGPDRWVNMRMNAVLEGEGQGQEKATDIKYPYKLRRGVSRQCIAIEILKKNGFDASIVDEAIAIKNRILPPRPSEKQKGGDEQNF
jgi:energy-coupling factor transporter ATP-binding protein EcfA2